MEYQSVKQFFNLEHFQFGQTFHIVISIVAFAILGLAVFQASLLYFQNQLLRNKSTSSIIRFLPSLETMEFNLFKIILLGFILLSFSLLSAWTFVDQLYTIQHFQKILLSGLAWGFFAILLIGRHKAGWRGPTAVRFTLIGFVLLIVAYFSSKMIFLKLWSQAFN